MPAQKRPAPPSSDHEDSVGGSSPSPPPSPPQQQQQWDDAETPPTPNQAQEPQESEDSDDEGDSRSSDSEDEFILVNLADLRKEVQCPVCLGIIQKTRTVMECLHRFCRECIAKSMRLGNNECPACRTHCASRRSLRDDPNYDALIGVLYPDIDKYEAEELAFHEEEKIQNRKIQASIAETFQRQTEALGRRRSTAKATASAFVRRSQENFRSSNLQGRGRTDGRDTAPVVSDDEDEDTNGIDGGKDSSEECSPEARQKRCQRWDGPQSSPARTGTSADVAYEENDYFEMIRESFRTSPLQAGNREMLAWGKGGARSQTRHGNSSSLNGRFFKGGRITKLVEHLRNLNENDDEFDVHVTLLPLDEKTAPNLERPYLCCRPTLSIGHLCQFISLQLSVQAEEVEILARKPQGKTLPGTPSNPMDKVKGDPSEELQILGLQESLAGVRASLNQFDLVLLYRLKSQS